MHRFSSVCLYVTRPKLLEKSHTSYLEGKGRVGQGQRSFYVKVKTDSKERQVGSQQRQVASLYL